MPRAGVTAFPVWGTSATVISAEPGRLVSALTEVERELDQVGRTCSRFAPDSDVSRVNRGTGRWTRVDPLLVSAVEVALRGARASGGLVDPTIGSPMERIGYDRDFQDIALSGPELPPAEPAPGWWLVDVDPERSSIHLPPGVSLDLGATAKAFAADRSAARAASAAGCGVLVSIGGDIATAGPAPVGGWSVGVADDHRDEPAPGEGVSIVDGGIATSSVTVRRWKRGGVGVHHIIDPRTGDPAQVVWRTVSVAAATCVDANIASTAAIVMGEAAPGWLASHGLPARLVRASGEISRVGDWPARAAA